METDVIIIGAGPTGLALACQFVRYGVDFVILDTSEGITPFSRAIGVQARTLELYEQIGLAEKAVRLGTIVQRVCLIEHAETVAEVPISEIGAGLSPYPGPLMLEQSKHEQLLAEHLAEHGIEVMWRTTLDSFTQDGEGVTAEITTASGEKQTIEAKYLVGCDGAKSLVRHELGLTFEGSTFERLFYVADVEIDWKFSHEALNICLAKRTFTAFFPLPGANRFRIVGTFPEGTEKEAEEFTYEEINAQVRADTEMELKITALHWHAVYKVHSRRVGKFSDGRCFVAGDAAHIHTPAGAQGMNTGIQDGYNLAWKLAFVLNGKVDPSLLATYDQERSENAQHLLETTDRLFDLGAGDHWFTSFFRLHVFPRIAGLALHFDGMRHFLFSLISQIGIHYWNSPLSDHRGKTGFAVQTGDRMPYFLLDGASIYDLLHQPSFHLLAFSNDPADFEGLSADISGAYSGLMDCNVLPLEPHVAELFGTEKPFFLLLAAGQLHCSHPRRNLVGRRRPLHAPVHPRDGSAKCYFCLKKPFNF